MGRFSLDVLAEIKKCSTLDKISRALGLREQTVRAIIETMVCQGLIEVLEHEASCSGCPFKCGNSACCDANRTYVITSKGFSLLEKEMRC